MIAKILFAIPIVFLPLLFVLMCIEAYPFIAYAVLRVLGIS